MEKHNETMSNYIQQQFQYPYTSTVVDMKIPALTKDMLDNETEY